MNLSAIIKKAQLLDVAGRYIEADLIDSKLKKFAQTQKQLDTGIGLSTKENFDNTRNISTGYPYSSGGVKAPDGWEWSPKDHLQTIGDRPVTQQQLQTLQQAASVPNADPRFIQAYESWSGQKLINNDNETTITPQEQDTIKQIVQYALKEHQEMRDEHKLTGNASPGWDTINGFINSPNTTLSPLAKQMLKKQFEWELEHGYLSDFKPKPITPTPAKPITVQDQPLGAINAPTEISGKQFENQYGKTNGPITS